ncbi:MAG: hypothetical protein JWQ42_4450 [Edaphobacter sp.]|nr:hypothetical protein [Edaphobacter sp.]
MPSPQIAAIILFYFQVVSGIAAAIFIGQWMWSQAKKFEGGVMISFPMKYPRLLMAMVAFSIICGVSGLWIVYHLPKPALSPLVTPSTSASNDPTIPLYEQKADPSTILAANQLINSYLLNHPGDKVGAVAYANSQLHSKGMRGSIELHDMPAPNLSV